MAVIKRVQTRRDDGHSPGVRRCRVTPSRHAIVRAKREVNHLAAELVRKFVGEPFGPKKYDEITSLIVAGVRFSQKPRGGN